MAAPQDMGYRLFYRIFFLFQLYYYQVGPNAWASESHKESMTSWPKSHLFSPPFISKCRNMSLYWIDSILGHRASHTDLGNIALPTALRPSPLLHLLQMPKSQCPMSSPKKICMFKPFFLVFNRFFGSVNDAG